MSNVTPMKPPKEKCLAVGDIQNNVMRAKQILSAVIIAEDHEATGNYPYALEQIEDLLAEVHEALGVLQDAEDRKSPAARALRRNLVGTRQSGGEKDSTPGDPS